MLRAEAKYLVHGGVFGIKFAVACGARLMYVSVALCHPAELAALVCCLIGQGLGDGRRRCLQGEAAMKIMTRKLALLRWLVGLVVAVMVSGCILPPPWMRELDPWALTNMTPDERPAEEIDWIEFEVEVSEHVKRVVVYGIVYNNGNRSCDSWALNKGGSLLLGEGSSKFIVPSVEISLYKNSRGLYVGSQLMWIITALRICTLAEDRLILLYT